MSAEPIALTSRAFATPAARRLLSADADRADWLAVRRQGIGGSDASTVAGVNPWESLYELWADKTGRMPEKQQTQAMRMGRILEPTLKQLFAEDTGLEVRRCGLLQSRERPWQLLSPDGLTSDGGLFESKTTNWRMSHEWEDGQVADHAEVQVQHGLAVTGLGHAWVIALVDGREVEIRRVERDQALIDTLTDLEDAFWHDHVLADTAPAVTARALPAVKTRYSLVAAGTTRTVDLPTATGLLDRWQAAKAAVKAAEQDADLVEAELRDLLGDAESLVAEDGTVLATAKANGTFSPTRFAAQHPDLAAEFTTPRPVLDTKALAAAHPAEYGQHRARVLRRAATKTKKGA